MTAACLCVTGVYHKNTVKRTPWEWTQIFNDIHRVLNGQGNREGFAWLVGTVLSPTECWWREFRSQNATVNARAAIPVLSVVLSLSSPTFTTHCHAIWMFSVHRLVQGTFICEIWEVGEAVWKPPHPVRLQHDHLHTGEKSLLCKTLNEWCGKLRSASVTCCAWFVGFSERTPTGSKWENKRKEEENRERSRASCQGNTQDAHEWVFILIKKKLQLSGEFCFRCSEVLFLHDIALIVLVFFCMKISCLDVVGSGNKPFCDLRKLRAQILHSLFYLAVNKTIYKSSGIDDWGVSIAEIVPVIDRFKLYSVEFRNPELRNLKAQLQLCWRGVQDEGYNNLSVTSYHRFQLVQAVPHAKLEKLLACKSLIVAFFCSPGAEGKQGLAEFDLLHRAVREEHDYSAEEIKGTRPLRLSDPHCDSLEDLCLRLANHAPVCVVPCCTPPKSCPSWGKLAPKTRANWRLTAPPQIFATVQFWSLIAVGRLTFSMVTCPAICMQVSNRTRNPSTPSYCCGHCSIFRAQLTTDIKKIWFTCMLNDLCFSFSSRQNLWNLMDYFKTSTSRDFRIDAQALQDNEDDDSSGDEENDTTVNQNGRATQSAAVSVVCGFNAKVNLKSKS